jgi:hypothetical protein
VRAARLVALAMLVAACRADPGAADAAAPWPALPTSEPEARALVEARTRRAVEPWPERDLAPAALVDAIDAAGDRLVAGDRALVARVQAFFDAAGSADAVLLWGTFHDAGPQIEAFRRLVGPLGVRGLDVVAMEQLRADTAWGGVPAEAQRGDGAELEAWIARGDRRALEALAGRHREGDYAAWKFGYEPGVLDLLVDARAAGVRVVGAEAPAATLARLPTLPDALRLRVRELGAVLALPPSRGPRRAAMLYGQSHVRGDGLPRYFPPLARVLTVHAIGQRAFLPDEGFAGRLLLADPVLVSVHPGVFAWILPDASTAIAVDRAAAPLEGEPPGLFVTVLDDAPATVRVGARAVPVPRGGARLDAPEGEAAYVVSIGSLRVAGAVRVPPRGRVELVVDAAHRRVELTERAPGSRASR